MTADVSQDRRVTATHPGYSTRFVDGSRLYWALPSPVHEGFGYRASSRTGYKVMRSFRMSFTALVQDHLRRRSRPIIPTTQRRTVLAVVKAWPGYDTICRTATAPASLDDACVRRFRKIVAGTKKHTRPNQETDMPCC